MMEWYQIFSYFLTNGIRAFLCLSLVTMLLKLPQPKKNLLLISLGSAAIVTAFSYFIPSATLQLGLEMILLLVACSLFQCDRRVSLFLIFFYEITVALWDFLLSAGLGVLLQSPLFVDQKRTEYLLSVWIVRVSMLGISIFLDKKREDTNQGLFRFAAILAVFGMFGVILLSEQTVIPLDESLLSTWVILSPILLVAVLFYRLLRQYEAEKEIVRLKAEQAELLKRDFQTLNQIYSTHAKLFHDFHNHMEILHRFLTEGRSAEALGYLEDLYMPMQEIAQTVWTGDEATDYLINSKISFAQQHNIQTKINIEFPRHTNIRSADLTAILGNLLDNALDATVKPTEQPHFIHLTIRRIHDMLIIKVENDCENSGNDDLQTTKSDGGLHGWGLKSARAAVEQYEGTIEITRSDHLFCAVATLSYQTRP